MQRIITTSLAAVLLALASTATASDVPSELRRFERHILCKAQACFDPLASYSNAGAGKASFSNTAWTAPSGLTCTSNSGGCAVFTVDKEALKAALTMKIDEELVYLVGNLMRPGRIDLNTTTIPFVILDLDVKDTTVVLYGGDRPARSWTYASDNGISIYP